jgi:hypothetical protein
VAERTKEMKVNANFQVKNFAMERIVNAIKRYAPEEIEFVDTDEEADLVIIYAYAHRRKVGWRTQRLTAQGKKYAIVQTSIRSTRNPGTEDWLYIWEDAQVVWSYYNLTKLLLEDRIEGFKFNFYYAPLGVDSKVFKEVPTRENLIIYGENRDECSNQVIEAIMLSGYSGFMLGTGITDQELVKKYSQSKFVCALRHKEGFELPVIEGLLCGATPIVFDRPETRKWFDGLAIFIDEGNHKQIVNSLKMIFDNPSVVTEEQKQLVRQRFNWETIIKGFWERIL